MRCCLHLWLILTALLALTRLEAQSLPNRRVLIDKVGETPMIGINDIAEDDRGFLWMGSVSGLYRYDGTSLEVFTDQPGDTTSIVPGEYMFVKKSRRNKGLWLGSFTGGLSYLDLNTERARNYLPDPGNPAALAGNEVAGLSEDPDGGLWVGTNQFTLHYLPPNGQSFQRFRPPLPTGGPSDYAAAGALGEIIPDRHKADVLWVGSRYGIYRFERTRGAFQLFPFDHQVAVWYRPMTVRLFMDTSGILWAGSWATGLCRLDPQTGNWKVFKKNGPLSHLPHAGTIQDLVPYDDNTLLVLTAVEDVWKLDIKQQTLEFLDISTKGATGNPLPVICGYRTQNGDLWLAPNNSLVRLMQRNNPWRFVFFPNLNPRVQRSNWQRAYAVSPDRNSLYIGTLRGDGLLVVNLKNEQTDLIPFRKNLKGNETDVFMDALCFDPKGRLWIGSDTGLLYLDTFQHKIRSFAPKTPTSDSLGNIHIGALLANANALWVGTKGKGLFRLDLETGMLQAVWPEGMSGGSSVNCLLSDADGRVWIGHEQGLTVFEPATGKGRHFSRRHKPPLGLSNDFVTDLELDAGGHLWISTLGGGILRLLRSDSEHPHFEVFYNNEVSGGNLVYEFAVCERGEIWLGTRSGFAVLDTATHSFVNYDKRDGMFARIGALIRLPDGRIVSGAHRGFHIFHPDSVLRSGPPPAPYLKRFRIFDREAPLARQIDDMEELTLTHRQNHFSFELGALNFGEGERTRFAYRLEGYDPAWVYSGSRDYVSYTNLPPGKYTFRVKAVNKHGVWSLAEKSVRISIRPAYWQTGWFRLAALLVCCAMAYGVYRAWQQRKRDLQFKSAVDYFTHATYQGASVRDILWDVAHKCMARLGFEDCVIYLLDESGEVLVQEAAYGAKSPALFELNDPLRVPLGRGIVGSAALHGRPELISDTRLDRRYIVDDVPRLSEVAVPILHDGRVIGVIDSEHSRRGFFTQDHVDVLKTIASLCADKIVQARAAEQMLEKERQLRALNQNLAESQLTALRAQMNPHFLFNCLNAINWYIIKNRPAEASRYIARFSKLIRLILEHSKNRQITLAQELDALRLYLDMEAMRFEHRFEYALDISPGLDPEEVMVPPLIFQPYVENAIWHGLMPKTGPGRLHLRLFESADKLVCVIEDNGIGRAAAAAMHNHTAGKRQSQGLAITEARIRQLNGRQNGASPVQFTDLYDADGQAAGTRVEVQIG